MSAYTRAESPTQSGVRTFHVSLDTFNILLIAVLGLLVSIAHVHNSYDDAFITYRYAYNLAVGQGFVYNVGERFMGTTAPFYGILLGILAIPAPEAIPIISGVLSGLSLILTGIALYVFSLHHKARLCGLLAGLFFVLNPLLPATFGGEMLFQTALIAWAFAFYAMPRRGWAAGLLALAILTRPDGIIAAAVIGGHYVLSKRRLPWRELAIMLAIVAPFVVLSFFYYGALLPGTLGAKLAQRQSGLWAGFGPATFEWLKAYTMQGSSSMFKTIPAAPHAIRYIAFIALGLPALLRFRFWLLPLAWSVLFTLGYLILDVPFYHWYIVPIVFGLMILAAAGVAGLIELVIAIITTILRQRQPSLIRGTLGVAAVLVLIPGLYAQLRYTQRWGRLGPNPVVEMYTKTGKWLAANTHPGASVGYGEIGYIGYYARRTIIDPLGLVNPGLMTHVAEREFTWAYQHYRPDYIIDNPVFASTFGKSKDEAWFIKEYREVFRIEQHTQPGLVIYRHEATR